MSYYVVIRGPLGVGKSTVARELATAVDAHVISIDRILEQHELEESREGGFISQRSFMLANEIAANEAAGFLGRKIPVVIDGNFYWRSQLDDLSERLRESGIVFTL